MNFNELNKMVNQVASYFKLNVKLINLDDSNNNHSYSSQTGYETDEDLVVEQLFNLPTQQKSTNSHNSTKIDRIHQELDGLNNEQRRLDEIIESFKQEGFQPPKQNTNIENIEKKLIVNQTNVKKVEQNIDQYKKEARKIMDN